MKKAVLLFLFIVASVVVFSQEKIAPVEINGDKISYLKEGKIVAEGNVRMKYKNMELFCDKAEYDANKNIANIKGNVKIVQKDTTVYGENIIYDFNKQTAKIINIRMESAPIYGEAKQASKTEKGEYLLQEGYVTTCDLKKPHYHLATKKITVYPKKKVVARNMVLKIGKIPIFYFPYYSHSLKDKSFPVEVFPGKDSDWGYYLLNRWRYYLGDDNRGKIHLDGYEKRGIGGGITHKMETKRFGQAFLNYYYINDRLYALDKREELFDKYPERKSVSSKYLENDRYKWQLSYNWQPSTNLSIKSEFHKFSDENFMKDFFYREFEVEPHPLSYTLIDYAFYNSSLSLFAQKRANRFFTETEYLPQLEYNLFRHNLGKSNFYFQSKTTLGNLTYKRANSDVDDDAFRFHSHNTLNFTKNIRWLYINPYTGYYTNFYSKNKFGDENILNLAPEVGIDLSTKLYRIFDVHSNVWGRKIDKLRHILTPKISYSYIHPPTVSKSHIFQFDTIDDLERKEKIILTLDNKLQARNEKAVWDFIYFSPSVEYQINKENKGSYFDKTKADFEIYPKEGVSLTSDVEYDNVDRAFKEANVDLTFSDTKNKKYSLSFGHRYSKDESSQSTLDVTYQLTKKLQFKNYLRYEYKTGDFKEQQYALRVDLHCWWMDLGLDVDNDSDVTFWVVFKLKAFPDVNVGFEHSYRGAKKNY
jgi:lipopolysaccharide assembly outer membrane protein LptD (OstA)